MTKIQEIAHQIERHVTPLVERTQNWIEELFWEEDLIEEEEKEEAEEEMGGGETEKSNTQDEEGIRVLKNWNLLLFIDCILAVLVMVPLLCYITNTWLIPNTYGKREALKAVVATGIVVYMFSLILITSFKKLIHTALVILCILVSVDHYKQGKYTWNLLYAEYRGLIRFDDLNDHHDIRRSINYAYDISNEIRQIVRSSIDHTCIKAFCADVSLERAMDSKLNKRELKWRKVIYLFDRVNDNWDYTPDPVSGDLFRTPGETVVTFKGDCDDYAMLMVAIMISLDLDARIIFTRQHMYPEVAIPNEKEFNEIVKPIIHELKEYRRSSRGPLYYHRDEKGTLWLNLDYTESYPGGYFMYEEVYRIIRL